MAGAPATAADAAGRPALGPLAYEGHVQFDHGLTVTRAEECRTLDGRWKPCQTEFVAFGRADPTPAEGDQPVELLSDLRPTTFTDYHLTSGFGGAFYFFGSRGLRHAPSCYPQETAGVTQAHPDEGDLGSPPGPTRCLRWSQGETNLGPGPLELHIYTGKSETVYQRVYRTDGSVRQFPVGNVHLHAGHGHFHYDGFQSITLHEWRSDGLGPQVATSPQKGICMVDIEDRRFGEDRSSPNEYRVPNACAEANRRDPADPTYPNEPFMRMGTSVGFADVYPWYLSDQYIDVSDVPDGQYIIRVAQDTRNLIQESDETNNVGYMCVQLDGRSATDCKLPLALQ